MHSANQLPDLDTSSIDTSPAIAPTVDTSPLSQYKTYIIATMPISTPKQHGLRHLLDRSGWPTVWQSLDKIADCADGRNWAWEAVDNELLRVLYEVFEMPWQVMAEYVFVDMRASQCEGRYKSVVKEAE